MNKLSSAFADGKTVVTYLTCGDPTMDATKEAAQAAIAGGAKVLILGIAFSDPTAVDAVIQESNIRALSAGATPKAVFDFVRELRADTDIPIALATYANVVFSPGISNFALSCQKSGVQGVILYDVPYEEQKEFSSVFSQYDVTMISAVSPSVPHRIAKIAKDAKGFLYIITDASTTRRQVQNAVEQARMLSDIACVVGCGVADAAPIEQFCEDADGAVLDYEIVHILQEYSVDAKRHILKYVEKMNALLNK